VEQVARQPQHEAQPDEGPGDGATENVEIRMTNVERRMSNVKRGWTVHVQCRAAGYGQAWRAGIVITSFAASQISRANGAARALNWLPALLA
jgi:hypothetical protein